MAGYESTCIDVSVLKAQGRLHCSGHGELAKAGRIAGKRLAEQESVVVGRQRGVQHLTGSLVPTSTTGVRMLGEVWYDRRPLLKSAGIVYAKHLKLLVGKSVEWDPRPDTQPELCGGHCDGRERGRKGKVAISRRGSNRSRPAVQWEGGRA